MPTNIEIKQLFRLNRLPDNELKVICLMFYIPVGIVLFILRAVLALSAVLIGYNNVLDTSVIHKLINKLACLSLGITVTVENPEKKENVDVFVGNSVSMFDQLVVHAATGSVSPGSKMQSVLARGLGVHHFGNITANLDAFKKNVSQLTTEQKIPVYFEPEEKITNGKALLKFKTYPFALSTKVQPIAISIERPLLDLSVFTLGSSYWSDVLCYMFSPITNYKLRFLPGLEKKNLSDVEFAEIVRQNLAQSLKIETSEFSASDLIEWEKRELAEQQRPQLLTRTVNIDSYSYNSDVRRMANQVKEVLPHVPFDAIFKDLIKTKNVDNTITNILEGRIHFVPDQQQTSVKTVSATAAQASTSSTGGVSSSPSTSSVVAPSDSSNDRELFNTAVPTFAKSANDRKKSFQERKAQLVANARKRYIAKNHLDVNF